MKLKNNINAVFTIAFRDVTKLLRDKMRILANFIFPVIFIGVLGTSLQSNLQGELHYNFLTFVFIGVLAQTLFQSTASGIISLIEDRQNDFTQELFISPISRYSIVVGKIMGETMVAFVQLLAILLFGFVTRIPVSPSAVISLLPFGILIALFGGAFGLLVISIFRDERAANQLFPFVMFPQFFLAGVFSPIKHLPWFLAILVRIAPMTYAVDLARSIYYFGKPDYQYVVLFNPFLDLVVLISVGLVFLIVGTFIFVRNERNK